MAEKKKRPAIERMELARLQKKENSEKDMNPTEHSTSVKRGISFVGDSVPTTGSDSDFGSFH